MNRHSHSSEASSALAELSGVLLESVEEVLREPTAENDITRALDRARQLAYLATPDRSMSGRQRSHNHTLERIQSMICTHKRLTVAAMISVTALAVGLLVYAALLSSPTSAYALEQTARANDHIVSYHIKITPPPRDSISEAWVQLSPDGVPIRARGDWLNTAEGPYVVIMSAETCDVWFKAKNCRVMMPSSNLLKQLAAQRERFDPKLAFEKLQANEKAGKVQVATQEPSHEGQPITLTVTSKNLPDFREAYEVDAKTKLVERILLYRRHGAKWEQQSRLEFVDYNKDLDPSTFELDVPKDVITANQLNEVGLAKGKLSDKEIAVKVVRAYFEAMIARDYAKASKIYSGVSAAKLAEGQDCFHYLRIVSIGEPKRAAEYMSATRVPVTVEFEITKPIPPRICSTSPRVQIADAAMATKAVRTFYEALIAQDYDKAGRIWKEAGMVDDGFLTAGDMKSLKKAFRDNSCRVSRIVEIGKPVQHPESGSTELPIKVEVKVFPKMGKDVKEYFPLVNPVMGQPGRWGICGGI